MDADAADFIARVQDSVSALVAEPTRRAFDRFITGCKADASPISGVSNWNALQAGCCALMAGWPSHLACFQQITGPAVASNNNFNVSDYSVSLGLKGNGSTKYIATLFDRAMLDQANSSLGFYTTEAEGTSSAESLGGVVSGNRLQVSSNTATNKTLAIGGAVSVVVPETKAGFSGASKWGTGAGQGGSRYGGAAYPINASGEPFNTALLNVFRSNTTTSYTTARMAWYHFAAAVDLLALERRLKLYMREISGNVRNGFPLSRVLN